MTVLPRISLDNAVPHAPSDAGALNIPLIRQDEGGNPFPVQNMGPLMRAALAIADATQAPQAICGQSVLAAAALAVQGLADVEKPGGGRCPTSLFCLSVASTGERKSGADALAMKGVRAFERTLAIGQAKELAEFNAALAEYKIKQKEAMGAENKIDALIELGPPPPKPLSPSITTAAPTLEGVIKNLGELMPSLGIFSDEGGAFLGGHSMKAENRAASASELSKLWDGDTVTRWRAGDGVSTFRGRRLACHLMVQPVVATMLLADQLAIGQGLLGRFLLTAPESTQGQRDWHHAAEVTSEQAIDGFAQRVKARLERPLPLRDGTQNELELPCLSLSHDARQMMQEFGNEIERDIREGRAAPALGAVNKAPEQACRIAGVMTLFADPAAREVSKATMADAIELARFYMSEALRLTGAAPVEKDVADAELLRVWLAEKFDGDFVQVRDIVRRGPSAVRDTARAKTLLGTLAAERAVVKCDGPVEIDGRQCREAWRVNR